MQEGTSKILAREGTSLFPLLSLDACVHRWFFKLQFIKPRKFQLKVGQVEPIQFRQRKTRTSTAAKGPTALPPQTPTPIMRQGRRKVFFLTGFQPPPTGRNTKTLAE
jgi:hypothetical protein